MVARLAGTSSLSAIASASALFNGGNDRIVANDKGNEWCQVGSFILDLPFRHLCCVSLRYGAVQEGNSRGLEEPMLSLF
jgi:hypothetical protein